MNGMQLPYPYGKISRMKRDVHGGSGFQIYLSYLFHVTTATALLGPDWLRLSLSTVYTQLIGCNVDKDKKYS